MKPAILAFLGAALFLPVGCSRGAEAESGAPAVSDPNAPPAIPRGRWKFTTTMFGKQREPTEECRHEGPLEKVMTRGFAASDTCSSRSLLREEGGWRLSATCVMSNGNGITLDIRATGDFTTRYDLVRRQRWVHDNGYATYQEMFVRAERIGDC